MAWVFEVALPFAPTGELFFSPIFGDTIYVIDQGTNFASYNVSTNTWAVLAAPTTGPTCERNLVPDDVNNPTRLFCISDYDGNWRGLRISTYTIATNTWADSPRAPDYHLRLNGAPSGAFIVGEVVEGAVTGATGYFINQGAGYINVTPNTFVGYQVGEMVTGLTSGQTLVITSTMSTSGRTMFKSLVYVNANLMYVWGGRYDGLAAGSCNQGRCISYNPAVGTLLVLSSTTHIGGGGGFLMAEAAINPANTIIYGARFNGGNRCLRYTVATDTYAELAIGYAFDKVSDEDKLWFHSGGVAAYRPGYLDTLDNSNHIEQFEANPEQDNLMPQNYGVRDNLVAITAHAKTTSPRLMSTGGFSPLVQTDPATEIT